MPPKIQKLTVTVLKNSGKADTNLSFNSLLQIRVQSLLSSFNGIEKNIQRDVKDLVEISNKF